MDFVYVVKSGSHIESRFFAASDFDVLEYLLFLFSLHSEDEDTFESYLVKDPSRYSISREGYFLSDTVFVPAPCFLIEVSKLFDFCSKHNFDGRYNVCDFLTECDSVNVWVDRFNLLMSDVAKRLFSPDSPPAIGSESSSRPDQPYYGYPEAKANLSASSDAGVSPACEEAQPPSAESEDNNA